MFGSAMNPLNVVDKGLQRESFRRCLSFGGSVSQRYQEEWYSNAEVPSLEAHFDLTLKHVHVAVIFDLF